MPNWCDNELEAKGTKEAIEQLQKDALNEDLQIDFNLAVPQPPDLGDGWYDWNVENWGTKWGPCDQEGEISGLHGREVLWMASFETAWAPPLPWLKVLAAKHPEVTLSLAYSEPGMEFEGVIELRGERVLEERKFTSVSTLHERLRGRG
jgi:hypothetical protein